MVALGLVALPSIVIAATLVIVVVAGLLWWRVFSMEAKSIAGGRDPDHGDGVRSPPMSGERLASPRSSCASPSSPNLGGHGERDDLQIRATGEVLVAGPQRIIDLVRSLPTMGLLSNEDEARISALQAVTFRLQFQVEELTDTTVADRAAMDGGKTAVGRLEDGVIVRVQLSARYIGTTAVGESVFVLARVSRWDATTRTLVLFESVE